MRRNGADGTALIAQTVHRLITMVPCIRQSILSLAMLGLLFGAPTAAQQPEPRPAAADNTFLLTIFLRHDESKTLGEINAQLRRQHYFTSFPPQGIEVVSWYVMMGIGQVVTLRVPANRLRDVNRAIEQTAWGGYRTEFYPTYDYKALAEEERSKAQ
jgi:hypothetical protein